MTLRERAYLDHNASSPLRPEATSAIQATLMLEGNPSSVHAEGRRARAAIERAREQVAQLCGVAPANVVFTSGGTEANALALSPGWLSSDQRAHRDERGGGAKSEAWLYVSAVEHLSVLRGGGFPSERISILPVNANGVLDLKAAALRLNAHEARTGGAPFMVSLMSANNETGAVQPVAQLAEIVHELGGLLHCDAVQSAGKIPLDAVALGADLLSLSAHKLGGPKGCGALIVLRDDLMDRRPLFRGGGQEWGRRAGTENIPGIAGFGAASAAARDGIGDMARLKGLRDRLEADLRRAMPAVQIISAGVKRLPNTSCLAVPGLHAETLVIALDLEGVAISAGSACSSGKVERSHVLEAMGLAPELAASAIRVSLGWTSTPAHIDRFIEAMTAIYRRHTGKGSNGRPAAA